MYGLNSFPGKGKPKLTDAEKQVVELQKQLQDSQLENEILKKSYQHFLQERQDKYRFIKRHKFKYPVDKMCKVLKISRSSYYNWLHAEPSKPHIENNQIMLCVQSIFTQSYESYSSVRFKAELESLGYNVSRNKIAKMMRAMNLHVVGSKTFKCLTDSNHNYPVAPNLLDQNFQVERKNQVWVSDMTYIQTKKGWLYLTVIIDLFSRKVIG